MKLKLKIMGVFASVFLMVSGASAECTLNEITLDSSVTGLWSEDIDSSCYSATNRPGNPAQYYTFTLTETETIQIDLESSYDTYVFLLSGAGTTGTVIDSNDDVAYPNTNSQILRVLEPGTYTIEAVAYNTGVIGFFTLTLQSLLPSTCILNEITLDSNVSGSWSSDCSSTNRPDSYAQYYTFTLTETETIQIDLESSYDTYMFLLSGGTIVAVNDDIGPGVYNSRILRELSAGTYTIEATTFSPGVLGDFNLTLSPSTLRNYSFEGTINLPAKTLGLLENCSLLDCPTIDIHANILHSDGTVQDVYAQVDYNDTTSKYEYQFDVLAEANTSMEISTSISSGWNDPDTGENGYFVVGYSFGADQAIGGTGSDADYPMEDCGSILQEALHVDLNTSLPIIEIDLSDYIPSIKSSAAMVLDNVPDNIPIALHGYSVNTCDIVLYSTEYFNENGSRTVIIDNLLIDGNEYGFILYTYDLSTGTFEGHRLNDNDGDFTNGGVFVDGVVGSVVDGTWIPVFDKTILVTPEDINISAPENLNFGNPALVPIIHYLLM